MECKNEVPSQTTKATNVFIIGGINSKGITRQTLSKVFIPVTSAARPVLY